MDLRGIANSLSSTVNPNIVVSVQRSNGFTAGPGYRQVPAYEPIVTGPAQIQALNGSTLQLVSGLNIQGDLRTIILRGELAAVVRAEGEGGDIVTITGPLPPVYMPLVGTWLVVKVLESWPLWTKAVIERQITGAQS